MRRRRIEAIEAENEEEFLKILAKKDEINDNLSSRRKRNKKNYLKSMKMKMMMNMIY